MTEEEVQQIYNYLHENYRYEDGELIAKKNLSNGKGKRKGAKLGYFNYKSTTLPITLAGICTNGKRYKLALSHFIYIFHFKIKPKIIEYIDKNPTNTKIENLRNTNHSKRISRAHISKNGYSVRKNKDGTESYRVEVQVNSKNIVIGHFYDTCISKQIYDKCKELINLGYEEKEKIMNYLHENHPEFNLKNRTKNKTKFKGVEKVANKFRSRLWNGTNFISLGYHDTAEEAHAAYLKAKREHNEINS